MLYALSYSLLCFYTYVITFLYNLTYLIPCALFQNAVFLVILYCSLDISIDYIDLNCVINLRLSEKGGLYSGGINMQICITFHFITDKTKSQHCSITGRKGNVDDVTGSSQYALVGFSQTL